MSTMEEKKLDAAVSVSSGAMLGDLELIRRQNDETISKAIEELGFGRYQWQMFFTCGFGFVLDQMLAISLSLILPQIGKQWNVKHPEFAVAALYAGSLLGAILCGLSVDVIGRKLVWQVSLLVVAVFTMIEAASPNFASLCVLIAFQTTGAGGNLAIDLTVFIECLPAEHTYMLTALALWWGFGSAIGGFFAWPLIANFSCPQGASFETCRNTDNMGWRYSLILIGGFSLVLAMIRIFLMKMEESPRWLVSQGRFEEAVANIQKISRVNRRTIGLTAQDFIEAAPAGEEKRTAKQKYHAWRSQARLLFANRKMARSTLSVCLLWMCIGIAYPVFTLFLPVYLQKHGAKLGDGSLYQTYRDYSISSVVGIFGPILAAAMTRVGILGRRRSMAITAVCAAAFAAGFTTVRNEASNLAFSSMVSFWQNAFYATLYAYSPEVMPTAARGTGCGISLACGRIASLSSPFIAAYGDLSSSVPLWVLVGVYGLIAAVALSLPFESQNFLE